MKKYYSEEKNIQILIAVLKAHGIKKVIVSPGGTNVSLVASMTHDGFFEMISAVDERSAAYMACGLAAESNEPVALSCTGATASRNYLPGLTEAYYRKLPVLAITSLATPQKIGHLAPQIIDRSNSQNDVKRISVNLPIVKDGEDFWECEVKVNQAILELYRGGNGPVHINLPTIYSTNYDTKELPPVKIIQRYTRNDELPSITHKKVAIFIGSHIVMNESISQSIEKFSLCFDAPVFCDHTSNYYGKNRLQFALVACQEAYDNSIYAPDLLIHIGEISGDYDSLKVKSDNVWRVNPDGEIRDFYKKLTNVFEMDLDYFFDYYTTNISNRNKTGYHSLCSTKLLELQSNIPEVPFSNIWVASKIAKKIPAGSDIHLGILNSLRSWNLFSLPKNVTSTSNVGGFGIDGSLSTVIGASLANFDKLYYIVLGDLSFFYDMNSLGNREIKSNLRVLLVNNGKGSEFKLYYHNATNVSHNTDDFISAAGHFGNKSPNLVKNYAENLGFEYLTASSKDEFDSVYNRFISSQKTEKPIVFEIFTNSEDESEAIKIIKNIDEKSSKQQTKEKVKQVLGNDNIKRIKKIINKK